MRNKKPRKHNIFMIMVLIVSFCFIVWDFISPNHDIKMSNQKSAEFSVNKTK